ncbi:MAG: sulfatase [Planctomycetota bacterium]|nr:sulfatase [Planctomycetota bacterium]
MNARGGLGRRDVLAGAAALGALAACRATEKRSERPLSVLVLLADDLSARELPCYGNLDARTPTIDALAGGGALFERAYTSVGVCQPSRSSLYTGLYPHHHGAMGFGPIRTDVATWPELLRERGVFTALVGKLDVDPLEKFPFDHLLKAVDMPGRRDPAMWGGHVRDVLARAHGRPFAAVIGLSDPHRPFDEDDAPRVTDPASVRLPKALWDTEGTRREYARHLDCIARLDRTIANALEELRAAGRERDTLVVFTSDNGASFPFAKSTLYEPGVRMPLVVGGPGVKPGRRAEIVSLLDVLPTVLDLGSAPAPKLDGMSLKRSLFEGLESGRDEFVSMQTENNREQARPARALHTRRFKYIRNLGPDMPTVSNVVGHSETWESGKVAARKDKAVAERMRQFLYRPKEELYDLERDPDELVNLADVAEHAARLAERRERLRAWMTEQADPQLGEFDA